MKQNVLYCRGLAWVMALLMTMSLLPAGLVQPARAAGEAAKLSPKAALDYYNKLSAYSAKNMIVMFADLRDMNGDRTPELVVISADSNDNIASFGDHGYPNALVEIWTVKNDAAVKSNSQWCEARKENSINYASRDGKIFIEMSCYYNSWGDVINGANTYIGMDNYTEDIMYDMQRTEYFDNEGNSIMDCTYERFVDGVNTTITEDEYNQYMSLYDSCGDQGLEMYGWWCWYDGYGSHESCQNVLNQLNTRAAEGKFSGPSVGGFGPYTIKGDYSGNPYTISFDAVKVMKRTVQIAEPTYNAFELFEDGDYPEKDNYPHAPAQVMLVVLRPDTQVIVSTTPVYDGAGTDIVPVIENGTIDGDGRFTMDIPELPYDVHTALAPDAFYGIKENEKFARIYADYTVDKISYIFVIGEEGLGSGYRQPTVEEDREPDLVEQLKKLISDRLEGEIDSIYELADGVYYILVTVGDTVRGVLVKGTKQSGQVVWSVADTHDEPLAPELLDSLAAQVQSAPNLTVDFSRLRNNPTVQAIKDYLQDLLDNMDGVTPNDPAKGELVSFLESAVASTGAGSVSGKDNRVTVPADLAAGLVKKAREAREELEEVLSDNDVALNKPVTVLIRVLWQDMDSDAPCQATLDKKLADALDGATLQLLLGDGQHYIQVAGGRLEELADRLGALSVQISRSGEGSYTVSFLDGEGEVVEKLPAAVTLALPASGPLSTIMASYAGGSDNWGGQYDPANGAIAFDTVYSGQYQVLENNLDIADIADLPEETRTAVSFLVSRGYLNLEDGLFRPDAPLTRYEFTEALVGMFFALDRSLTTRFQDVPKDSPYYAHVASAEAKRIVEGLSADTFGGDQNITTEQLLALAARTLIEQKGYTEPSNPEEYLSTYTDGDQVSGWARNQTAMAVREGLVDRGALLNPQGDISRAQAAVVLYRLFLLLYEVPPVALELPPVTGKAAEGGGVNSVVAAVAAGGSVLAVGGGAAAWFLLRKKTAVK